MTHYPKAILTAVRSIYARDSIGCCCHIFLDDDNYEDEFIEYCLGIVSVEQHMDCFAVLTWAQSLPEKQRKLFLRSDEVRAAMCIRETRVTARLISMT